MFTPIFVSFLTLKLNSFVEKKCFEWESNRVVEFIKLWIYLIKSSVKSLFSVGWIAMKKWNNFVVVPSEAPSDLSHKRWPLLEEENDRILSIKIIINVYMSICSIIKNSLIIILRFQNQTNKFTSLRKWFTIKSTVVDTGFHFRSHQNWRRGRCQLFHDGGLYHIETSSLICSANQWTGFYMIVTSVMKVLTLSWSLR